MWRAVSICALLTLPVLGLPPLTLPAAAQEFFTLKGHGGPIMDIAVSPSGQIATASFDNSVGVWDASEPIWLDGHSAAVNALAFIEDGVVVSASDDFTVKSWRTEDGIIADIGVHKGKITDIAYHRDTHQIATASWDGTVGLWGLADRAATAPDTPDSFKEKRLTGHKQGVNAVAFSSDGNTVYSASVDGSILLWDPKSARQLGILVDQGFGINELVVTDTWIAYGAVDGATRVLDHDGLEIADFTLDRRPILSMAYNASSDRLAVGDGEGYIMVIDTKNWRIVKDFRATRRGPVWALAFSNDGQNIHAGGIDDVMYSWPVATMDAHTQMGENVRSFLEDPKSLPNGERQFKRKCSICHSLTPDTQRRAGPTLHQIFGRAAGTLPDYRYSETLSTSDIVWTRDTIDKLFDDGPDHYIPGSKMPMQRIAKSRDRLDLINYLARVTTAKGD